MLNNWIIHSHTVKFLAGANTGDLRVCLSTVNSKAKPVLTSTAWLAVLIHKTCVLRIIVHVR